MGFMQDKKVLIVGAASTRSIAWGVAQAMRREGAQLAFTYQGDRLEKVVRDLAAKVDSEICMHCDVCSDHQIEDTFAELGRRWEGLDGIVHSVAFAPRDQLAGNYADVVSREGFDTALDISAYSLAALAKAGREMMRGRNGALVTMTYLGSVRVVPNYNVMGVAKAALEANVRYLAAALGPEGTRVNAISAGPIRTLAASGISDFRSMLSYVEERTPLRRNVTIDEVGNAAAFLCSDLASAITGDVLYVDTGFHVVGMT
jgi:enoyl-[acyl-carrier protein] reductase I